VSDPPVDTVEVVQFFELPLNRVGLVSDSRLRCRAGTTVPRLGYSGTNPIVGCGGRPVPDTAVDVVGVVELPLNRVDLVSDTRLRCRAGSVASRLASDPTVDTVEVVQFFELPLNRVDLVSDSRLRCRAGSVAPHIVSDRRPDLGCNDPHATVGRSGHTVFNPAVDAIASAERYNSAV
jgi:hypothetical protein